MDCREKLMAAERELTETQARLVATERVLHTVLGVLTPAQFSTVREDLDLQDFLSGSHD
jgi:hypothetical protein